MDLNTIDKIIYTPQIEPLTGFDATNYSLKMERDIYDKWKSRNSTHSFFKTITFGLASLVLQPLVSKEELENRITTYRTFSLEMEAKAKVIQRLFAKKHYQKPKRTASSMSHILAPQFNSALGSGVALVKSWINQGGINFWSGPRGQVIWDRTKTLYNSLFKEGYYVFLHAHSYPISLHLELASSFQAQHLSRDFIAHKPLESQRKFRAPGIAKFFENTTTYLKSYLAKSINSGWSMDDHHRETILSCDAIPDNDAAYESTQHFFKSNRSIVDTKSSTGMTYQKFDSQFIASFISNRFLQNHAVDLFSIARNKLSGVADYGMIRVIAIAKQTLKNPETNYVWRSHPFGRLCTCKHTHGKFGHNEFIATLENHQKGNYKRCSATGHIPQYRILTANLDRDTTKQVYTMDCLNEKERQQYNAIFKSLKTPLSNIVRLEHIHESKTVAEMAATIASIDLDESSPNYKRGIAEILKANSALLKHHLNELQAALPRRHFQYLNHCIS